MLYSPTCISDKLVRAKIVIYKEKLFVNKSTWYFLDFFNDFITTLDARGREKYLLRIIQICWILKKSTFKIILKGEISFSFEKQL